MFAWGLAESVTYMIALIGNEDNEVFDKEVMYRKLFVFFIDIINSRVSFQTIFDLFFRVVVLSFSLTLSVRR